MTKPFTWVFWVIGEVVSLFPADGAVNKVWHSLSSLPFITLLIFIIKILIYRVNKYLRLNKMLSRIQNELILVRFSIFVSQNAPFICCATPRNNKNQLTFQRLSPYSNASSQLIAAYKIGLRENYHYKSKGGVMMFVLGLLIGGSLGLVIAGLTMSAKEASEIR